MADAERNLRRVLRRASDHLAALDVLAIVLMAQQRHAEAEPHLQAALRRDARSEATLANDRLLKALHRPNEAKRWPSIPAISRR